MRQFTISGDSAALDADGLANDVAYSGGGFALTANAAGDSLAHLITILGNAATNHNAKTFTVTGTNANGEPQSEGIAGPNGVATVTTTKYFLTVTSVAVDATTGADTFDIGWAAGSASPWEHLDAMGVGDFPAAGIGIACLVDSGSPTYTLQYSNDGGETASNHADIASETTSQNGAITTPVGAVRLSWAAAGGVTLYAKF